MPYILAIFLSLSLGSCKQKAQSPMMGGLSDYVSEVSIPEDSIVEMKSTVMENPNYVPEITNLPVLRLNTADGAAIESKEVYTSANLKLDLGDGSIPLQWLVQIRGRGNSTWLMPKKPYKIKFTNKTALLGMPADKEWVLLANYSDKTLLRTRLAFEMGQRFGLPYSPRSQFVEVFINDRYEGTYQLTENIKISKSRVDITALAATDITGDALTGGYLLELDQRRDGTQVIVTRDGTPFVLKDPEPATEEQLRFITGFLQTAEDSLAANMDLDSFVSWYLVQELARNNDAEGISSIWMYKPRLGALRMGPLWDFDIAFGNVDANSNDLAEGWNVRRFFWAHKLFQDPEFAARVRTRWNELKGPAIDTLFAYIDAQAASLAIAQSNNYARWLTLDKKVWPNPIATGSYEGEVSELKFWLVRRVIWMDSQFNP